MSILLILIAAASPQAVPTSPPVAIPFATGNLQNWDVDRTEPSILYVRDRRRGWYRVTLSGDCPTRRRYDQLNYTTDNNDRFDVFSRIRFGGTPEVVCGINDIQPSAPPPGQPRERKPRR